MKRIDHMTSRDYALNAFIAAKADIDEMLQRLTALSADHFNTSPDEVNWGYVGTLEHYRAKLRQIIEAAFHEGEYAETETVTEGPIQTLDELDRQT